MIYITGDIHGDISRFSDVYIPNEKALNKDDYLIICGDFGFIFEINDKEKELLDTLEKKQYNILWIDGNHENFDALNAYPVELWKGGKIHRIRKNIIHLMRGQVFTIENKKFFTMGGAYSMDKYMRKEGVSWWPQELPNNEEYKEASENLFKNKDIDYILTHTAPKTIIGELGYYPDAHDIELTGYFEWIKHEFEFKHWFFGHLHEDRKINDKFTALFFDVVKLP